MAAGDAVQVGLQYLIGTGYTYYQAHCVKSSSYTLDADSSAHKDCRGATDSILTQDHRDMVDAEFDIVGMATAFKPPAKDSLVTFKGLDDEYFAGYRVVTANVSASSGIAKLTMSLVAEDSMGMQVDGGGIIGSYNWDISDDSDYDTAFVIHGATAISAVYGAGVLLTETTHYTIDFQVDGTADFSLLATYIGTVITDPADELIIKICPNYGMALTLTLTGTA